MIEEALRRAIAKVLTAPFVRWLYRGTRTAKLSIAPQDLRTADPTVAAEIYAGRFAFAGKFAAAGGRSPFELYPPSLEWADALYGFGWLRHLRAADSALARANARALVEEWIDLQGRWHAFAWLPEITARRVLAWLSQSPLVLERADFPFYRKFVMSLTRQVSYLTVMRHVVRPGAPRLQLAIALAQASLCLDNASLQKRARRWLTREIEAQILADGGHVSRNPAVILQMLLDLLPLRHSYTAVSQMPPQALLTAIDRMMPMIRFFRHGDGAFALFNGMGPTPADIVATLLAYDDTRGTPPVAAPMSGYLRVEAGDTRLLMDGGAPPPTVYSGHAHAGPLSFEFSDGPDRVIVNCGMPWTARSTWAAAARSTAAHSTLQVGKESCAQFLKSRAGLRLLGPLLLSGARHVAAELAGAHITASHDGYVKTHNVLHRRKLTLSEDGDLLSGFDEIVSVGHGALRPDTEFALRFHLHPSIKVSPLRDGEGMVLLLPGQRAWEFRAVGFKPVIEESLYLGGSDSARRTEQIVLRGTLGQPLREARWRLARCAAPVNEPQKTGRAPQLPL